MATVISTLNQKGGVGKSTLTVHLATYLNIHSDREVQLFDCDFPQHSIEKSRESDLLRYEAEDIVSYFQENGKNPYPITSATIPDMGRYLIENKAKLPDNQIIFVDMPGSINQNGYLDILERLDAIILPMEVDELTFKSTIQTLMLIAHSGYKNPVYLLWNKINPSESKKKLELLHEALIKKAEELGVNLIVIDYVVKSLVGWKDNRSTLFAYPKTQEIIEAFAPYKVF